MDVAGVTGSGTVERDGLVFDVTTAGPADGEPVVLLHGFPQSARCWDAVTPALAAAGPAHVRARPARLLAGRPPGRPGRLPDGRGGRRCGGRGRGGSCADRAVARARRRARLGRDRRLDARRGPGPSSSTPSPGSRRRRRAPWPTRCAGPASSLASWYLAAFAVPGLAERVFAVPRGASWSPRLVRVLVESGQTRELAERDAARLADPAALTAALNWYRAIPLRQGASSRRRPHPRCSSGATATPP